MDSKKADIMFKSTIFNCKSMCSIYRLEREYMPTYKWLLQHIWQKICHFQQWNNKQDQGGACAEGKVLFFPHNSSVASAWIKTPCLMYHTAVQFSSNGDNSSFLASFKTLPSYVYMYTLKICYLFIFFVRHMLSKSTLYSYSNRFRDLKYSVLLASNTIVSN